MNPFVLGEDTNWWSHMENSSFLRNLKIELSHNCHTFDIYQKNMKIFKVISAVIDVHCSSIHISQTMETNQVPDEV